MVNKMDEYKVLKLARHYVSEFQELYPNRFDNAENEIHDRGEGCAGSSTGDALFRPPSGNEPGSDEGTEGPKPLRARQRRSRAQRSGGEQTA